MESRTKPTDTVIRVGRAMQGSWGIALGVALAVSLNGFILISIVSDAIPSKVGSAYLIALVLFAPIVLTYVERMFGLRGTRRNDLAGMSQSGTTNWEKFGGGWLLLLGYVALVALVAWGAGVYLSLLGQFLLRTDIAVRWLALLVLAVVAFGQFSESAGFGSMQNRLVYSGVVGSVVVMGWVVINRAPIAFAFAPVDESIIWQGVALLAGGLWMVGILLDYRQESGSSKRGIMPAFFIIFAFTTLAGYFIARTPQFPIAAIANSKLPASITFYGLPGSLQFVFTLVGFLLHFLPLSYLVHRSAVLVKDMVAVGYLPAFSKSEATTTNDNPNFAHNLLWIPAALLIFWVPASVIAGLASFTFLWLTALLNLPELVRPPARLKFSLPLKLPFHPLFPALSGIVGLLLVFALPMPAFLTGIGWVILGAIFYYSYAVGRMTSLRDVADIMRDKGDNDDEIDQTNPVAVALTTSYGAEPLIQAGARLAQARDTNLVVLQVLALPASMPPNLRAYQAKEQLNDTATLIERANLAPDLHVTPFIRTAPTMTGGILDTVREEKVQLLLMGWVDTPQPRQNLTNIWEAISEEDEAPEPAETETDAPDLTDILDEIIRIVPCEVAILRGKMPAKIETILLPSNNNHPHSFAQQLGQTLLTTPEGNITNLHIIPPNHPHPSIRDGQKIVEATDIPRAIVREARSHDLLLMHASHNSLLEPNIFGAIPAQVARQRQQSTLLLRPAENPFRMAIRNLFYSIVNAFPTITPEDRAEVSAQFRAMAEPTVDYFVLIALAAAIATLGLLLNSGAVIIGAMLVAPLMSPIASMAMGVVEGDVYLIRVAAEAIVKGLAMAIVVGVFITLILPDPPVITEILNRTQPNLIDLGVALASGAAGGYALSRKGVNGALPGVSIAVALVPPLCVVGFGIAQGRFDIAGGAFLLFSTNVIAIILAAAIVLLLLGFRPLAQMEQNFQRSLRITVIGVVLIAIPLAFLLNVSLEQFESRQEQERLEPLVADILKAQLSPNAALVHSVDLVPLASGGYNVDVILFDYGTFNVNDVSRWEALLNNQDDAPQMNLRMTILPAILQDGQQNKLE